MLTHASLERCLLRCHRLCYMRVDSTRKIIHNDNSTDFFCFGHSVGRESLNALWEVCVSSKCKQTLSREAKQFRRFCLVPCTTYKHNTHCHIVPITVTNRCPKYEHLDNSNQLCEVLRTHKHVHRSPKIHLHGKSLE